MCVKLNHKGTSRETPALDFGTKADCLGVASHYETAVKFEFGRCGRVVDEQHLNWVVLSFICGFSDRVVNEYHLNWVVLSCICVLSL